MKVSINELNECFKEAMLNVLNEGWIPTDAELEDLLAAAQQDRRAQRAFGIKTKKKVKGKDVVVGDEEDNGENNNGFEEVSDEDILDAGNVEPEEEEGFADGDAEEDGKNEFIFQRVRTMSNEEVEELYRSTHSKENPKGPDTANGKASANEKTAREAVLKDVVEQAKEDGAKGTVSVNLLNGKQIYAFIKPYLESKRISLPYGWAMDPETGELYRTHEFNNRFNDTVDISNSNGTNFHWRKTKVDVHGNEASGEPSVGIPNANWAE